MNKPTNKREHQVLITVPSHVKSFSVTYLSKFGTKVSGFIKYMVDEKNKEEVLNITNALIEDTHNICKNIESFKKEGLGKAILWSVMSHTKKTVDEANKNIE